MTGAAVTTGTGVAAPVATVLVYGRFTAPTVFERLVVPVKTLTSVGVTIFVAAGVAVNVAVGVAGNGVAVDGGVGDGDGVRVGEGNRWIL
jgi:hypothetical protein